MAATDQEHGEKLGLRFLRMCRDDGATGTALLNAMGNALVGFFMTAAFDNHQERMAEVDKWCAELKKEISEAYVRTTALKN